MRPGAALAGLPVLALLLGGCGMDPVAGKTTTTGNGGGLVAMGPDGSPAAGCLVLAARSWDPVGGVPGAVDTLRVDKTGFVRLPAESYAFVEVRDEVRSLGAWVRRVSLAGDERKLLALDTLRAVRGNWGGAGGGRVYLDSSFQSSAVASDGSFAFPQVPAGRWALRGDEDGSPQALGTLSVAAGTAGCGGCGEVSVALDPTAAPQWIEDFEAGSNLPRLYASWPGVSPWYLWWVQATMVLPASNDGDSILKAIGPDSVRAGKVFHGRFKPASPYAWIALGLTSLELDWSARQSLCFGYRSDTALKIQVQRDSVGTLRPAASAWVPASKTWRDVCVPFSGFVPDADVPDSLATWPVFGKRIRTLEFHSPAGTYLDLDDILVR